MFAPPLWISEVVDAFWSNVGEREPFPRSLQRSCDRSSFDLTIEELPALSVRTVEAYLARRGITIRSREKDRPLRGCLVAQNGAGCIFVDAHDEAAERRYSLAHELGHFLAEYWLPRQRVVETLGMDSLEVLDGLRPPTPRERLRSLLRHVTIGCHFHLMHREEYRSADVTDAEDDADDLALELLAPVAAVRAGLTEGVRHAQVEALLVTTFGLPSAIAADYARSFVEEDEAPAWLLRLKKAQESCRTSRSDGEQDSGGNEHDTLA
jgi:Zn-dependent peptidase ImmA (M78 family)